MKTRQHLPKIVQQSGFKLQKGESKVRRDRKKMVIAWRDKGKPTILISSVHSATITNVTDRRGSVKQKPVVVDRYNQHMGGVDKADQYSAYYSFSKRSVKWWKKLMFWLLEVAIVNSYILYKATVDNPLSHSNYRWKLILGFCTGLPTGDVRCQMMRVSGEEERFLGRHYLQRGDAR